MQSNESLDWLDRKIRMKKSPLTQRRQRAEGLFQRLRLKRLTGVHLAIGFRLWGTPDKV